MTAPDPRVEAATDALVYHPRLTAGDCLCGPRLLGSSFAQHQAEIALAAADAVDPLRQVATDDEREALAAVLGEALDDLLGGETYSPSVMDGLVRDLTERILAAWRPARGEGR